MLVLLPLPAPYLAMPEFVSQDVNGIEGPEIQLVFFIARRALEGVR
jgi:hypothetical protein